jgi:hypothetical protein
MLKKVNEKYIAIPITVICLLLVPGIMAKEGWDDHTRANKYSARDFARNYLESCAPNAILITNGDNDTFPLWYAQEVEGVRTDVRVVNFMLSSGDWYVHQLMRKAYKSDPLPFTLSYEQYNKGINEVSAYSGQLQERVELQDLIDLIASDNPAYRFQSGTRSIAIYPTKKVRITLDSASLVKDGIVPANLADKVVGNVEWDIKSNYLYKNDLMLLDFLAKNKFKRPVYFVSPSAMSDAVDVDKYCYQEGYVYRFLPVNPDDRDYIKGMGSVNSDVTYDVLMNKSKWGNLNAPGVYVDRESMRNIMPAKQNFYRLARKLTIENKNDSAVKVCDYVQQIFPDNKISFDYYMIQFVDVYYKAGAFDKGNKLAERLFKIYQQNLDYFLSVDTKFRGNFDEDINEAFSLFNTLKQIAEQYNQKDLAQRVEKYMNERTGVLN